MRGTDGVLAVVEQLAGALVPASALETLVLPARVRDYSPAMLDELTSAGEVLWAGAGGLPGGDGWISLVPADLAPLLLPEPLEVPDGGAPDPRAARRRAGAVLPRALRPGRAPPTTRAMADLVWDLVWAGALTNDTLAPLRTRLGGGGTHRSKPAAPRARAAARGTAGPRLGRPPMPIRTGPPTVAGRWSRLPDREPNATRRTTARTEALLERHGVLTRGAVMAEQVVGGFSAVYPVLRAFEENNRARRGYFVETLGAAQFGTPGSIDRLRTFASPDRVPGGAVVLAATDPANVYGAALPWPERPAAGDPEAIDVGEGTGSEPEGDRAPRRAARPARWSCWSTASWSSTSSAAARRCCRGPRTSTSSRRRRRRCPARCRPGRWAAWSCRRPTARRCTTSTPLSAALQAAGFAATPRGLRLRA